MKISIRPLFTLALLAGPLYASDLKTEEFSTGPYFRKFVTGVKGQAVDISKRLKFGEKNYFVPNAPDPFIYNEEGTVSLWVRHPDRFDYAAGIFGCAVPGAKSYLCMSEYPAPWSGPDASHDEEKCSLYGALADKDGKGMTYTYSSSTNMQEWTHLAMAWDKSNVNFYMNGQKINSQPKTADPALGLAGRFYIGANQNGVCDFKGQMDELMVFKKTLSDPEIASVFRKEDFSGHAALVLYCPFDGKDAYKIKRYAVVDRNITITMPRPARARYFGVGAKIPVTIKIPAGAGLKGEGKAVYRLLDGDNKQILSEEKGVRATPGADLTETYDVSPERCGCYWLEVSLRDAEGKEIKKEELPFAMIVNLPPLAAISPDSPLGGHCGSRDTVAEFEGRYVGQKWNRIICEDTKWDHIEQARGLFYWDNADRFVNEILKGGFEPFFTINEVPLWATSISAEDMFKRLVAAGGLPKGATLKSSHRLVSWYRTVAPPKDMGDWERFVRALVRRYKDRIHHWEILNEPNTSVFTENPAAYVEMLKIACRIVHEEDPAGKVIGCDGFPGGAVDWVEKVLQAGGGPYMDVCSVHNYNYNNPIQHARNVRMIERVRALLKKYLGREIPVWDTETGFLMPERVNGRPMTEGQFLKKYGTIMDTKVECTVLVTEHRAACYEVWAYLLGMAAGCDKVILHCGHGVSEVLTPDLSQRYVLTEKGVAFAAMAKVASDRKTVTRINTGSSEDVAGVLVGNKAGENTAVLFAEYPTTLYFPVTGKDKTFKGMDYLGNPLTFEAKDGLLSIKTGLEQVYVFDVPSDLAGVEILHVDFGRDGQLQESRSRGSVKVTNPFNSVFEGTLNAVFPEGFKIEMQKDISIQPRSSQNVDLTCLAADDVNRANYKGMFQLLRGKETIAQESVPFFYAGQTKKVCLAPNPIKVDGHVDDWKGIPGVKVAGLNRVVFGRPDPMFPERSLHWQGPEDLAFTVKIAWLMEDAVYLLVEVVDDKLYAAPPGKEADAYKWDCVELFFDGRTEAMQKENPTKPSAGAEHLRIIPALTGKPSACRVHYKTEEPTMDAHFVGRKTGQGYLMEGLIKPNKRSFFEIEPGVRFGLDVAVNDTDEGDDFGRKRKSQLTWMGTGDNWQDTGKWGRFMLYLDVEKE